MDGPEFVLAVLAIGGGIFLTAYIFGSIFKLIRMGIESKNSSGKVSGDVVSMKEFIEYKLRAEKRIQTLEAIVVDQDLIDQRKLDAHNKTIDVEPQEEENDKFLRNRLRG
ncbi:MAG TPA: hypothetical protein DCE78_11745 [Bacteroidetes bacterium]|nr:hypothetical protein [Bacteroidota bacterium]